MKEGRIIIVSGPSGVGKGTVLGEVMRRDSSLRYSVSATTRSIRPGEADGVNYFFVSKDRFEQMIQDGELLEYASYAGNYYGTPVKAVNEALAKGINVVLEIEVQGALQVIARRPDAISIFIAPPSYDELKRRLSGRGDTPPDIAAKRLEIAINECALAHRYEYIIVNDTVTHAAEEIIAILTAESCKAQYRQHIFKEEK